MQILLDKTEATVKTAVMRHGNQTLYWDVRAFNKRNFETEFDMFEHTNAFWSTLSMDEQGHIFDLFTKIKNCLEDSKHIEQRISDLTHLIAQLYSIHNLARLERWIKIDSDIKFPAWLQTEYDPTKEHHVSREQTYVYSDYVKLIGLAFALRLMIPIWSEYIGITKHDTKSSLKEYHAYRLLMRSEIFTCEAMEKLRAYIEKAIPTDKPKSAIIGGLSSAEFPNWVLAVALIRKICIGDIRGVFPPPYTTPSGRVVEPPTLVTYVFNHVIERIKHHTNNFVGLVKDKNPDDGTEANSEQQMSRLEGYKIKMDISAGRVVLIEHAAKQYLDNALRLEPTIDLKMVQDAVSRVQQSKTDILDAQVTIMQWVFKPVISPRGIFHLNESLIKTCLGVAEAVLWHRGHYVLAGLMSADIRESEYSMQAAGTDSSARVTDELNNAILAYYPYARKSLSRAKTAKSVNQAYAAIDLVENELSQLDYTLNLAEHQLPILTGSASGRRYAPPHDLRLKLIELVIDLAKRSEATYHQYQQQLQRG